ncbi:MAG: hypothetical protein HY514_00745 [Candidatus Aenigmarchaeota archaeon]|nr:hypothetical protein [Candidatus Aenigmarchaeota archaeon]
MALNYFSKRAAKFVGYIALPILISGAGYLGYRELHHYQRTSLERMLQESAYELRAMREEIKKSSHEHRQRIKGLEAQQEKEDKADQEQIQRLIQELKRNARRDLDRMLREQRKELRQVPKGEWPYHWKYNTVPLAND